MADSVDKLSAATGISRESMLSLWDEVKANHARMKACSRHDFPVPEPVSLGRRYECRNCRGWADASAVRWYQEGLKHGGASV